MLTHISERLINVARGILLFLFILAFGVNKVNDAGAQEFGCKVVAHLMLAHKGVAVAHALQYQRHHDGH